MKGHTKLSIFTILSILLMLTSITAKAAVFSLIDGDEDTLEDRGWDPSGIEGLSIGTDITIFDEAGEGVWIDGPANLVYTYIGKEAGSVNASSTSTSDRFFMTGYADGQSRSVAGSTFETFAPSAGFLDFSFEGLATCCVLPGTFTNGIGNSGRNGSLSLAVAMLNPSTLYLMFGDGFGDADLDDMVVKVQAISAVPVPAAFWLFGTALIGFIGMSARTKV